MFVYLLNLYVPESGLISEVFVRITWIMIRKHNIMVSPRSCSMVSCHTRMFFRAMEGLTAGRKALCWPCSFAATFPKPRRSAFVRGGRTLTRVKFNQEN